MGTIKRENNTYITAKTVVSFSRASLGRPTVLVPDVLKSTFLCVWSPAVCLCDLMMGHFSTSVPINEFGMGLIPPMDIQTGSLTAAHCDE